jgi:hypothetical protein
MVTASAKLRRASEGVKKNTVYQSLSHRPTVILYLSFRLATKFLNENPKCLRFCPKFSNRLSDDVIISLGSQFSLSVDVI